MKAKLVERVVHKKLEKLKLVFTHNFSDWGVPYFEILSPCSEVGYLRIAFTFKETTLYSKISTNHITDFELRRSSKRRKYSNLESKKSVARTTAKLVRKIVNGSIYMSQDFDENENCLSSGSGAIEHSYSRNPQKIEEMSRVHGVPIVTKEWNWFGGL